MRRKAPRSKRSTPRKSARNHKPTKGKEGGGIRPTSPPEVPGALPHIHVADAHEAFAKALREGAVEMLAPTRVMEGVTVAIVRAPGGVPVGFSGP